MTAGVFSIPRSLWTDPTFKKQAFTEREAFIWLVGRARWKAGEHRAGTVVVHLERGQLADSVRFMADEWSWSKSTVDRFLKRLEKRDSIRTESGTGINVITICNYNESQGKKPEAGTPENQNAGQQRDSSGTKEKKVRREEEKKNSETRVSATGGRGDDSVFSNLGELVIELGCSLLSYHGSTVKKARPLVTQWRKAAKSDEALRQLLIECYAEKIEDPVTWIEARLQTYSAGADFGTIMKKASGRVEEMLGRGAQ